MRSWAQRSAVPVLLLALAGCGGEEVNSGDVATFREALSAPHLQYYGYYRDDGYLSEIQNHANLTLLGPGSNEDGVPTAQKLVEVQQRGMKAMLDTQSIFAITANGSRRPDNELWPKWNAYVSNISSYVNNGTVKAFYMFDEPDPNATPQFWATLEWAAAVVHNQFPSVSIAMGYGWWNLAYPSLFHRPAGFDWFGFNCYGPFDSCMTTDGTGPKVRDLFFYLKSQLLPGQRIMLVPEASNFFNIALGAPYNENDFTSRLDQYMQLAIQQPSVVGVMPFLWSGQFGPTYNPDEKGLRQMTSGTQAYFASVGQSILNQTPSPAYGNDLASNEYLYPGQYLASSDGRFQLYYQGSDGNLVLYGPSGVLWASYVGHTPGFMVMQGDGNLVIYDWMSVPVWNTGTPGYPNSHFYVQNDGNLVVYSAGGQPTWNSGTCCQ